MSLLLLTLGRGGELISTPSSPLPLLVVSTCCLSLPSLRFLFPSGSRLPYLPSRHVRQKRCPLPRKRLIRRARPIATSLVGMTTFVHPAENSDPPRRSGNSSPSPASTLSGSFSPVLKIIAQGGGEGGKHAAREGRKARAAPPPACGV